MEQKKSYCQRAVGFGCPNTQSALTANKNDYIWNGDVWGECGEFSQLTTTLHF